MGNSISENVKELHSALSDYIEAVYHISDPNLVKQRQDLLKTPGIIYQEAYIESTPRYVSGDKFGSIKNLPQPVLELLNALSTDTDEDKRIIYNPPYKHQLQAVEGIIVEQKNLMIMTGTGSGKTESFLLPIIGKLVKEAASPASLFTQHDAVRALILYPMNALVNDQLGRVRSLFRDIRLKRIFKNYSGRIPTFARYTSRTPYPGVRDVKKDQKKLKSFEEFYVEIEQAINSSDNVVKNAAVNLMNELKSKGKWPAKPSLSRWYGGKGARWQDKEGNFQRAVTLSEDSELITRQEIQASPPDLLITNYSMLEYMLMRPIERDIFQKTLIWLKENPQEKFLIVIDEAHLYRGAAGAEVGLLLRRLRERLEIPIERFQVICATASFENKDYALEFASQLSGVEANSFIKITGEYAFQPSETKDYSSDVNVLASINLDEFYSAVTDDRKKYILPFLDHLNIAFERDIEFSLFKALQNYGPLNKLINITMGQAKPINEIGNDVFSLKSPECEKALGALLAFGSLAKKSNTESGLLPCRVHTFFRGLPGLWVCIDPKCTAVDEKNENSFCGKLYGQPREHCECGGRVFELYTCRNCGTAYARAYTDNIEKPSSLWSEPGKSIRLLSSQIKDFFSIDLLLENPTNEQNAELAFIDVRTGRLNPDNLGNNYRRIYIRRERIAALSKANHDEDEEIDEDSMGKFTTCCVCNKDGGRRESAVQDHQTKGDQPFLSLLSRQIQIQPPNAVAPTRFAPLRGRKVLIFSDSRQIAAKLAPNLQTYSLRDTLRPLLVWGYKKLQSNPFIAEDLCLDDAYFAILIAANYFQIRLRPELNAHETFSLDHQIRKEIAKGALDDQVRFNQLFVKSRNEKAPESLLKEIVNALSDRFTGLEPLAIASLVVKEQSYESICALPNIPGVASTDEQKIALANYWVRCWQGPGYWLKDMTDSWWRPAEAKSKEGVKGHPSGKFKKMNRLFQSKSASKIFNDQWLPELKNLTDPVGGIFRIVGKRLTLDFSNNWIRCRTCSSVQRPFPGISHCLECESSAISQLDPATDSVFHARKGYYLRAVNEITAEPATPPMALIAAEHTAQLNASQSDDVFSKAEQNELLFQDINIEWPLGQNNNAAIDILSSTTTMEVGIDIGALSGVALRNMPPGRANYQQRAGRAGRRGNAIATVMAFGSVDSHDEHFFSHPKEMISGPVVDPIITLNNVEIVKRHIRAFLLQKYHQNKLPEFIPSQHAANLFSVLGTVGDFLDESSILNRNDFKGWLEQNEELLKEKVNSWIPSQLDEKERAKIIADALIDCIAAVDDAIDFEDKSKKAEYGPSAILESGQESLPEPTDPEDLGSSSINDGLLDRLLYRGKLPRYAFPTDVATFHVFDKNKSTTYNTVLRFAPSQGLPIALSQYAPDRQVWIANKCYTSGALYSPIRGDLYQAWVKKRLYYECSNCGYAKTEVYNAERKKEVTHCDACGEELSEPFNWVRPPGFAHPVNIPEETSPDGMPEVGYATRAKLYMPFSNNNQWININENISGLKVRRHLLVSNTGPSKDGYIYCVKCGKIEATENSMGQLGEQHPKPYPDENPLCDGHATSKIVLGTDFITDVALFSINLTPYVRLVPGSYTYDVSLRTLCEALSKAASQILDIEPNDIVAEYRPALTHDSKGRNGEQVEIFLYDTLPGGAGFATQLADRGKELFERALSIMESCKENCDSSCYRCLRSFKNKFEHRLLDRHVGIELTRYILTGILPVLSESRILKAASLLLEDLLRNATPDIEYILAGEKMEDLGLIKVLKNSKNHSLIAISSPLTPNTPINATVRKSTAGTNGKNVITIDEFLIRNNIPSATKYIIEQLNEL